jgi:hypothetical protein
MTKLRMFHVNTTTRDETIKSIECGHLNIRFPKTNRITEAVYNKIFLSLPLVFFIKNTTMYQYAIN